MTPEQIRQALAAPFDPSEVKFKPGAVSGSRAMAIAYVDARVVMDRLDDVFGLGGWQTSYRESKAGVICQLRVKVGQEWVTHEDMGGESEQKDEGDREKSAFSDSLKRVAVHLGVGRYLYRLKSQWVDYDPQKKQFVRLPTLPGEPSPRDQARDTVESARRERYGNQTAPAQKEPRAPTNGLPTNAKDFVARLVEYEGRLVTQGLCKKDELVKFVVESGRHHGQPANLADWDRDGFQLAAEEVKAFEAHRRAQGSNRA